jgi:hypothetical protein
MGLDVLVGVLVAGIGMDEEGEQWLRRDFSRINEVLREQGLPEHVEPERLEPFQSRARLIGLRYSWIHDLRRVQARLWDDPHWVPTPVDAQGLEADTYEDDVLCVCDMRLHLLCHSDYEGYCVPLDFPEVVMDVAGDRIPGGMLGSSVRLKAELIELAAVRAARLRWPQARLRLRATPAVRSARSPSGLPLAGALSGACGGRRLLWPAQGERPERPRGTRAERDPKWREGKRERQSGRARRNRRCWPGYPPSGCAPSTAATPGSTRPRKRPSTSLGASWG